MSKTNQIETMSVEPIQPALWTISEICRYLNIARPTFYNLKSSGKFAPLSVGLCRKVLCSRSEVEAWIRVDCPHRKIWHAQRKDLRL